MRFQRHRHPAGFTLLETLIGVALFLLVTASAFTVFLSVSGSARTQRQETVGRLEINNALELIVREIAMVGYNRNKDDIDGAEADRFVFWADIDDNSSISLDNNPSNDEPRVEKVTVACDLDTGEVTRTEDQGGTLLVMDDVVECGFEYYDGDGVLIDEDGNPDNGQQITQQKFRDRIRRVRLTIVSQPYGSGDQGKMIVNRDIALPNMDVEQLEECGRVAIDTYMTVKACDPPGERGEITVTTYDKDGDRSNENDVTFTVIPSGSEFQYEDGGAVSDSTLLGGSRSARETVYFEPDSTEAWTEYTVSVEWTPPEEGCWKRVANAMMKVVSGDPCSVEFVEAPEQMVVCQPDGYDPGVNVVVAVTDMCGNFVPDAVIQVEIVGNDVEGSLGTIEGSPARPEIRSDQYGKAYFKYRPPATVWPESIQIKATIVGDLASDECDPQVTHVFPLVANTGSVLQKHMPDEPVGYVDDPVDMAVTLDDMCGNGVVGLENLHAEIADPNPLIGHHLTGIDDGHVDGVATLSEVNSAGEQTPGVYWFRLHPGNGGFTAFTVRFSHPELPDGEVLLTYSAMQMTGCDIELLNTPETQFGAGLPYNSAADDLAEIRFRGYLLGTHAEFAVTGGTAQLFKDASGTQAYTSGELIPLGADGFAHIWVGNDTAMPTPIGGAVTVKGMSYAMIDGVPVKGVCEQTKNVNVVCSPATLSVADEEGTPVDYANPWDPTLSSDKMVLSVSDKNLPPTAYSTVTVSAVTDQGDSETITLTNGSDGGYVYTNGSGTGFTDVDWRPDIYTNNGSLDVDLVGSVWVTYSDPSQQCSAYTDTHTVLGPVDGCEDIFAMDFETVPSDSSGWSVSYRDFTGWGHPEWNYADWEAGTPVPFGGQGPDGCPGGQCYGTNIDGAYGADASGGTQTTYLAYLERDDAFEVTGLVQAFLFFDMYMDMGSGSSNDDGACGYLERKVGTDGWDWRNHSSYNDEIHDSVYRRGDCWGGDLTGGQWVRMVYPMRNEIRREQGEDLRFRFAFLTTDADYEAKPGMYIDNVRVCGSSRGN